MFKLNKDLYQYNFIDKFNDIDINRYIDDAIFVK